MKMKNITMLCISILVVLIGVNMKIGYGLTTEIETKCNLFDCYTILQTDKLFDVSETKYNIDLNTKEISISSPLDIKLNTIEKFNNINEMKVEFIKENKINVSGKIKPNTDNYWGLEIDGDKTFWNSTWWNSSFDYRYPIYNSYTTNKIVISVNGTEGFNGNNYWVYQWNDSYIYCSVSGCDGGLFQIANETDKKYWENQTSITGNVPASTWSSISASIVHHGEDLIITDSAGYNENSTVVGDIGLSNGIWENSLYSDADTDQRDVIRLFDIDSYVDDDHNWTVSLWFNSSGYCDGDNQAIIWTQASTEGQFMIKACNSDDPSIRINSYTSTPTEEYVELEANPVANQWYFIVMTHDEITNNITGYLNGTLIGNRTISEYRNNNAGASLFGQYDYANSWCKGTIDEFRIYQRVLNITEIQNMWLDGQNSLIGLGSEEEQPTTTTSTTSTIPVNSTITEYVNYFCQLDNQLVRNYSYWNGTDYLYEYNATICEYNCSETILGTRCNYSPEINFGLAMLIFGLLILFTFMIKRLLEGLFK